jgi:hypothetical protein
MLAAYTPKTAASDQSLESNTTGGGAIVLTDLSIEEEPEPSTEVEFDTLIDLDGGIDLFSSNEDSMDLSMQWLQGYDADKLTPTDSGFPLETIEEVDEQQEQIIECC